MELDVVVAHREPMVAEGLAAALRSFVGIRATSFVSTLEEALTFALRARAAALDESLPGSRQVALELRRRGVRVIMLGTPEEEGETTVSTRAPVATLAAALVPGARRPDQVTHDLTARERQILSLITRGMAGKQVAKHLGISPKTIEHHKTRIFSKLGVANQTAAACLILGSALDADRRHDNFLEAAQ